MKKQKKQKVVASMVITIGTMVSPAMIHAQSSPAIPETAAADEITKAVPNTQDLSITTTNERSETSVPNIDNVKISDTFPDAAFVNYISQNFDADQDGYLSESERNNVTSITITGNTNIKNIQGIEVFPNLESLFCANTGITKLDVSDHPKLEKLDIRNADLRQLDCSRTNISELLISGNPNLTSLQCNSTNISELNVSEFKNLTNLRCLNTALTKLDISQNTKLQFLYCSHTKITDLDAGNKPQLAYLDCSDNSYLTNLNVQGSTALKTLNCYKTSITSLNIDNLSALTSLNCSNCPKLIDLTTNAAAALKSLYCNDTNITILKLDSNPNLTRIDCYNNSQLESIQAKNIKELTTLNCYNTGITDLNVEGADKLKKLSCYDNPNLTTINLAKTTSLTDLVCFHTGLKALDITQSPKLMNVSCYDNPDLETLKIQGATALTNLDLHNTGAHSIDVSQNPNLRNLNCSNTEIRDLDVSQNGNLASLSCENCPLTNLNIGDNQLDILPQESVAPQLTFDAIGNTFDLTTFLSNDEIANITELQGAKLQGHIISAFQPNNPVIIKYKIGTSASGSIYKTVTLHLNIQKGNSTVVIGNVFDKRYDGKQIPHPTISKTGSQGALTITYEEKQGNTWVLLPEAPIDAGVYRVHAYLEADTFYNEAAATENFTITKAENSWTTDLHIANLTYGETVVPTAASHFGDPFFVYSDAKNGTYTTAIPVNAGTWYVKAVVNGADNYNELISDARSFTILAKNIVNDAQISISDITDDKDLDQLLVKDGNKVLIRGVDYEVTTQQVKNQIIVTLTFKGNYTGTINQTYETAKEDSTRKSVDTSDHSNQSLFTALYALSGGYLAYLIKKYLKKRQVSDK